jgi:zinc transport system permease protein
MVASGDFLAIALVSPDVARTTGVNVRRLDLIYLEVFALTVALGLRFLGVLRMSSLIIIAAPAAKRLSNTLNQMLTMAAVGSVVATLTGSLLAEWLHRETGPLIVSVAAAGFVLTFAIPHRPRRARGS